jgi:Spy/CpxP family protein refolding chaperone
MTDQGNIESRPPERASRRDGGGRGRAVFVAVVLAVALVAGLTGSMLSTAFGQGYVWQHFGWQRGGFLGAGWQRGGFFGAALSPAQIDDRIDRITKHMAIELDATSDQQAKLAGIAKAAVGDLRPLREQAQAARARALTLLTAPSIDRSAIDQLRAEQIALAETASKRIAQALADASDVLTPEQRRRVADWITLFDGPWAPWRRG